MSLFADDRYQWRETYFVLFDKKHRPKAADVKRLLADVDPKLELKELSADGHGYLDNATLLSHADAAGMDVIYVTGDEVKEQVAELRREWKEQGGVDKNILDKLPTYDARYDVFHFEEIGDAFLDEEDDILNPAALLLILSKLARLCHGISVDPQAGPLE
jgi:hypothetical protein